MKKSMFTKQSKSGYKSLSRTQKTVALSIATILSTIIATLTSMIMARLFTKVEFAAYRQVFLTFNTFMPILGLGVGQGIYYFLVKYNKLKRKVINKCLKILFFSGTIYALFIILGGNSVIANKFNNSHVEELLLYMIPYSIVMIPSTIISPVLISEDRIKTNSLFNVIGQIIIATGTIISLMIWRTANAVVGMKVILSTLVFIPGIIYIYRISQNRTNSFQNIRTIEIVRFSLPLALSAMLATLTQGLDKWLVSLMYSPEKFAIFSVGAFEIPFIGAITGAVSAVIVVDLNKYVKDKMFDEALELFKNGAKKTAMFLIPAFMFLLIIAEPFICFLFTIDYIEAVPIFSLYLLLIPLRVVFYGPFIIALGKSKAILYNNIILFASNLGLSYFLVKHIGPIGATIGTIVSIYSIHIPINIYIISKSLNVKWYTILPFKEIGKYFALSIIPSIFCLLTDFVLKDTFVVIRLIGDTISFGMIISIIYFRYFGWDIKKIITKINLKLFKS